MINERLSKRHYEYLYNKLKNSPPNNKQCRLNDHYWICRMLYPEIFGPHEQAIFTYMSQWTSGYIVKTTHDNIECYTGCSKTTIKKIIKVFITFGLLKRIKIGNNLKRTRSEYQLLEIDDGENIRKQNENEIQKFYRGRGATPRQRGRGATPV